ncbi:MAG TPA: magnesium chelatase [Symbiobacteriaceae bacterium]|jgi:magnesium chelatase subunit I
MDSVLGLVRHGGNEGLFKAIEMSLLATAAGQPLHLHAEGLRGTGKTTVMRAARRVLPRIRRINGCLYNCDPAHPHCPQHRGLTAAEVAGLGEEWVGMPFLEISHSAKVGTVVGSIDLRRLVNPTRPEAALLPGTIPQAHRGIIFVDEINRLAETSPELADILLDVMGTKPGRVQIEETGLPPVELPVQVTVWAASNPDEDPGPLEEIRRQLSDRFDFAIYTDRPAESAVVEQILAGTVCGAWPRTNTAVEETRAELYRTRLLTRLPALRSVEVPHALRQQIADIYTRFSVESLRAVQALHLGLRLAAALNGREQAAMDDLARLVPLALRHRIDQETMKKVTAHLGGLNPKAEADAAPPATASRHRFGNIGFGGALMAAPADPAVPRPPAPGPGAVPAPDRPAAPPPEAGVTAPGWNSAAGVDPAAPEEGWLSRTLATLQRNLGLSGPGQGGRSNRPDPLRNPPVSPPHAARPLAQLKPQEYIRTEGELGRR